MKKEKRAITYERRINWKKVIIVIDLLLLVVASVVLFLNKDKIFKNKENLNNRDNLPKVTIETSAKEKTIEDILEEFGGETIERPREDTYIVKKDDKEYTIYSDGEIVEGRVSIWSGKSKEAPADEAGNYNIYTPEELKWIADKVINGEKNFSGVTITLRANLDLGGRQTEEGTWEGEMWTAIVGFLDELPKDNKNKTKPDETGKENLKRFAGCFDGNGFWIRGLYSNTENKYQGLFGYSSGIIQNLILKSSYISGKDVVGGIVGINGGTIQNCRIEKTAVTGENKVGGIVGLSMTSSTVRQCSTENSKIVGKNNIGGIIGYLNNNASITESSNNSQVSGENYIGGIMGISFYGTNVDTNSNSGRVRGDDYVGGICGYSQSQIEKNVNSGEVKGVNYIGGLVGVNHTMGDISKSYNSGSIDGESNVGGIVGTNNALISNCYNKGNISASKYRAGGICGQNGTDSYVYTSYNIGKIDGMTDCDGIAGGNFGTITNSYYLEGMIQEGSLEQSKTGEELKSNITLLLGEEFIEDSKNINKGYPVLNWQ